MTNAHKYWLSLHGFSREDILTYAVRYVLTEETRFAELEMRHQVVP